MAQAPSAIIRQVEARSEKSLIFMDEAQKVPEVFDSIQYLIDKKKASFIITGQIKEKGREPITRQDQNIQDRPFAVKSRRLDPAQSSIINQ
jgi:hypothetical protein